MAGVGDKIKNSLFVWGNASAAASDMAVLDIASNGTTPGAKGGKMVYADQLNSGLRGGTLFAYVMAEALKKGPSFSASETLNQYTGDWYDGISSPVDLDYKAQDGSIADIADSLNGAIRQFLKYSQVYFAVRANVWNRARSFKIADATGTHEGPSSSVDGSQDAALRLPETIDADITGSAYNVTKTIAGIPIGDIFVSAASAFTAKVKSAAEADAVLLSLPPSPATGDEYPVLFAERAEGRAKSPMIDRDFTYNQKTGTLTSPKLASGVYSGNYAECSTGESAQIKTAQLPGFALVTGAFVIVKFSHGNTASSPKLNVNSTGAIAMKMSGAAVGANADASWRAGDSLLLVYDGSSWALCKTYHQGILLGICYTPDSDQVKLVSCPGFIREYGARVSVYFDNMNTASNAKLNVNGTGAAEILYCGIPTDANHAYTGWGDHEVVDFVWNGTSWIMVNRPVRVHYAESATEANHAATADTASSADVAETANRLGDQNAGGLYNPVYLALGVPLEGYYSRSMRDSIVVDKCLPSDPAADVTTLSFSYDGVGYANARCFQTAPNAYVIEADVRYRPPQVVDMGRDMWFRISLNSLIMTFFGAAVSPSFFPEDYASCTVSPIKKNLAFDGPVYSAYVSIPSTGTGAKAYAYIGNDSGGGIGFYAHISFAFSK